MQTFTGIEYHCIDIANQYGLDKELFEDRIQWVKDNFRKLERLGEIKTAEDTFSTPDPETGEFQTDWKERPLYSKAVQALRDVMNGKETGHMIGFDATCSGLQIMSTLAGCIKGALATNLIDPTVRKDAYTEMLTLMQSWVPTMPSSDRKKIKLAVVAASYGSKREPENLFGEDTPEIRAFNKAMIAVFPGATDMLNDLSRSWQAYALKHSWRLPDNHHVHVKVMDKFQARLKVEELGGASFTYEYNQNVGLKFKVSNVANIVHSIDAYLLRSIIRRCNYNLPQVQAAIDDLQYEIFARSQVMNQVSPRPVTKEMAILMERFKTTQMLDVSIVPFLTRSGISHMSTLHLKKLHATLQQMVVHKPFPVCTVHDEFKCHSNNMNQLRFHFKEIMAEMAESNLLDDILSDVYETPLKFDKLTTDLGKKIRGSNYGLS